MKISETLSNSFKKEFEELLTQRMIKLGLVQDANELHSDRFLKRAVVPHILKLSRLFNRQQNFEQDDRSIDNYWRKSSNTLNFKRAYFLGFMPPNAARIANIWEELQTLGFKPSWDDCRAIEWGGACASGATGIEWAEKINTPILPSKRNWALIDQDATLLKWGEQWLNDIHASVSSAEDAQWNIRTFQRKIDPQKGLLPIKSPKFHLWIMSFFLNEFEWETDEWDAKKWVDTLVTSWERHLEKEGIVIIVEPALKQESRQLLTFRKELLDKISKKNSKTSSYKVLLPCLGHQVCGALENPKDWCHEVTNWWRPHYLQKLDELCKLDHKSLAMSYLVIMKTKKNIEEILPCLKDSSSEKNQRYRLVSPARSIGKDQEFFVCGQTGKHRCLWRKNKGKTANQKELERGTILENVVFEEEKINKKNSSNVKKIKRIKSFNHSSR